MMMKTKMKKSCNHIRLIKNLNTKQQKIPTEIIIKINSIKINSTKIIEVARTRDLQCKEEAGEEVWIEDQTWEEEDKMKEDTKIIEEDIIENQGEDTMEVIDE